MTPRTDSLIAGAKARAVPPVIRKTCGTVRGAAAHHAAGERLCGWCARSEQYERVLSELAAPLPPAPGMYAPVTEAEAALNRRTLDAEVLAYEQAHMYQQQRRDRRAA